MRDQASHKTLPRNDFLFVKVFVYRKTICYDMFVFEIIFRVMDYVWSKALYRRWRWIGARESEYELGYLFISISYTKLNCFLKKNIKISSNIRNFLNVHKTESSKIWYLLKRWKAYIHAWDKSLPIEK